MKAAVAGENRAAPPPGTPGGARAVFLAATWFGLATGLLEGAGFLVLQKLGWPGRTVVVNSVSVFRR